MFKIKRFRSRYPEQQLIDTGRAVKNDKMTSVKASQLFIVPESTIRAHVINSSLQIGGGCHFYNNSNQGGYLVDLIKSLEFIGVRLTKIVLRKVTGEFISLVSNDSRFKSEFALSDMNFILILVS